MDRNQPPTDRPTIEARVLDIEDPALAGTVVGHDDDPEWVQVLWDWNGEVCDTPVATISLGA